VLENVPPNAGLQKTTFIRTHSIHQSTFYPSYKVTDLAFCGVLCPHIMIHFPSRSPEAALIEGLARQRKAEAAEAEAEAG
jgi:hypothetical protein